MLIGKKFPQNVRARRIVAEEILRPISEDHPHAGDWHNDTSYACRLNEFAINTIANKTGHIQCFKYSKSY